jgi:hypothetical protein
MPVKICSRIIRKDNGDYKSLRSTFYRLIQISIQKIKENYLTFFNNILNGLSFFLGKLILYGYNRIVIFHTSFNFEFQSKNLNCPIIC